jgi:hypothetical protein
LKNISAAAPTPTASWPFEVPGLELLGQLRLNDLVLEVAMRAVALGDEQVVDELHRQRGGALQRIAVAEQVLHARADDALVVERPVLVEAPVLDRHRRLPQPRGDLVGGRVLVHRVRVHVAERRPVGREDLGRRIGLPGVQLAQVRGRVRGGDDPADREQRRDRHGGHR